MLYPLSGGEAWRMSRRSRIRINRSYRRSGRRGSRSSKNSTRQSLLWAAEVMLIAEDSVFGVTARGSASGFRKHLHIWRVQVPLHHILTQQLYQPCNYLNPMG